MFPNITIALRIFICLPALVASGERAFSVLKQVKNYCSSTMEQDLSNGFATLSINCDLARMLDCSSIINAFSEKWARKVFVK
jgi:hypothetical protein